MSTTATVPAPPPAPPSVGAAALKALRATRKRRRLGEVEWFDAAYKVYVVALFGGIALLWLSDLVGDDEVGVARAADALAHGPRLLGLGAALALLLGLRGGSQGGPLALEAADVVHVMLSPVDRRTALARPAFQRIRSVVFASAMVGAALGQMAGRRLPGTAAAWFWSGGLYGLVLALLWVGGALAAHTAHLRLAVSTLVGLALVAWQGVAIAAEVPGPGDTTGSLAFWGWRQEAVDLLPLVAAVGLVAFGCWRLGRTSLDALARRSTLVAQLRFAVTMQDLRTVILLRRQLTHERTRSRPWVRLPRSGRSHAVWRRGWHSLLRLPVGRLVRMAALAAGAGACQVAVRHGTTPAILGTLVLTFVLGLEVLEPLSQEVDQPNWTDSFPVERGDLMFRQLAAPAVALIPFALIGGAVAVVLDVAAGDTLPGALAVAGILCVPTAWAGAAGGAVNIVRDAPDPLAGLKQETFMPPEMAGMGTVLRTVIPLAVSATGALPVLLVRKAIELDGPDAAVPAAIRYGVLALLIAAGTAAWVRFRDRMRRKFRAFMAEGQAYTKQQRSMSGSGMSSSNMKGSNR